jgi:hypothetical protein
LPYFYSFWAANFRVSVGAGNRICAVYTVCHAEKTTSERKGFQLIRVHPPSVYENYAVFFVVAGVDVNTAAASQLDYGRRLYVSSVCGLMCDDSIDLT